MNSLQKYVFPTIPPNKTQKNLHIFSDNTSQLRTLPHKRGTFSKKCRRKKKKRRRFSEKRWRFFHAPHHSFLSPWKSSTNPPRGRVKSTTALLTFQHSHARAYARTSAILYFLLSQPSHISSQSPITVIDTLLFTHFLCRFSESPRRNATENTLKNVRKTAITNYVTIRYKDFCEGCESKKHKTPVTRARGRGETAALKICSHRSL